MSAIGTQRSLRSCRDSQLRPPGIRAKISDFREHLRAGTDVYVTFLAGSDFGATIEVAKRLRNEGFNRSRI